MKKLNLLFIGTLAVLMVSCAVSRKVQYDNLVANIEVQGTKSIAIAALDHREHVLVNGKAVDFVGYMRSAVGIPYPVGTKSKKPFANDVATSINQTLSGKGYKCSVINTTPKDAENDIINKLKASSSDISILFLMNEWWTDTSYPTFLNYDVRISLYDKSGTLLATKKFAESKKNIAGMMIWGNEYMKFIPNAFKTELEKILNDPDIKNAIQ